MYVESLFAFRHMIRCNCYIILYCVYTRYHGNSFFYCHLFIFIDASFHETSVTDSICRFVNGCHVTTHVAACCRNDLIKHISERSSLSLCLCLEVNLQFTRPQTHSNVNIRRIRATESDTSFQNTNVLLFTALIRFVCLFVCSVTASVCQVSLGTVPKHYATQVFYCNLQFIA